MAFFARKVLTICLIALFIAGHVEALSTYTPYYENSNTLAKRGGVHRKIGDGRSGEFRKGGDGSTRPDRPIRSRIADGARRYQTAGSEK